LLFLPVLLFLQRLQSYGFLDSNPPVESTLLYCYFLPIK